MNILPTCLFMKKVILLSEAWTQTSGVKAPEDLELFTVSLDSVSSLPYGKVVCCTEYLFPSLVRLYSFLFSPTDFSPLIS